MGQGIAFYGAAETVTGSRHLLTLNGKRVLVDCGLFQGSRELRERNWAAFPVDPGSLDAVIITHAHLDHIGWLPRLVKDGYSGPIYSTPATRSLARISLPDSGRIQEEDAHYANKIGSRHTPALPLYTETDAYASLKQFVPLTYRTLQSLPGGGSFRYSPAGHILGSAFAEVFFENGERILMSGDLGRFNTPVIRDPASMDFAEYLVVESTYGDRLHSTEDPLLKLEQIFKEAWHSGGVVLIPSFAIGRTQELLYYVRQLQDQGRIPRIPIFIDSPMATSVTHIFLEAKDEFDEDMLKSIQEGRNGLEPEGVVFVRDKHQSQELNIRRGPMVIIAGSGMANAGRIQHHLIHHLGEPSTIVLFTGYQAEGTLGRYLLEGAPRVRIRHEEIEVRAKIDKVNALSAHADQGEIMHWLHGFQQPPKRTFIVHGEPPAQEALQNKIREELGWDVVIPKMNDSFEL